MVLSSSLILPSISILLITCEKLNLLKVINKNIINNTNKSNKIIIKNIDSNLNKEYYIGILNTNNLKKITGKIHTNGHNNIFLNNNGEILLEIKLN